MRNHPFLVVLVITIFLAFVVSTHGQTGGGASGRGQQDLQNREWALSHVGEEVNSHFPAAGTAPQPNIREDFQQLQVSNNELMKAVFVHNCVEPRGILTAMAEIKKRATRLRTNLGFDKTITQKPATEEKAQTSQSPDHSPLTSNLLRLDQAVMSFVNNPLFHQPKLVDSKLTTKADDDLAEILRVVEVVRAAASGLP